MDRDNKNELDSEDVLKEEQQLINEIQSILHKKYDYSLNQMRYHVPIGSDSQKMADLVVFNENESPIIIVEVKGSRSILPLYEFQLRELIFDSKAEFGLLYNGTEKRAYQKIGNSLIQINDIPKMGSIAHKATEKFKPFILPEEEIWRLAENVRRDFHDYNALLQVLALKILDEEEFKGNLFKSYYTKPFDEEEVIRLLEVGKRYFPELFMSSRHLLDNKIKLFQLLDTIKNFSFQKSNIETITMAILKFSMYRSDWFSFPYELSSFMLDLLSIPKNKKILVPYAGLGYCFDITRNLRKSFKLTKQSLSKYVKNYFAVTEINSLRVETLRIISLLRKEPFSIFEKDFLLLDEKDVDDFEYILSMPPIMEVYNQKEINYILGNHGRKLINYVLIKLLRSQKSKSKVALLVSPAFLFQQDANSNSIRLSILRSGFLRAIIQLPHGLLLPLTNIPMALILIDFHNLNTKNPNCNNIFLSQISEINYGRQKLDPKILRNILNNFRKFEKGQKFKESVCGFILHQDELTKNWMVSDKTPEARKILEIPNGKKLDSLGKIFYGKPGAMGIETEIEIERKLPQIPYLRISDIQNGLVNYRIQNSVVISDERKYSEFLVQEDDVLISCQGTIGKVAIARKKDIGIWPSPQIAVVRSDRKKILPDFLVQALNSEKVQNQLRLKSRRAFISRLNNDDLRNIVVPVPPLSKQKELIMNFQKKKERIENIERELELAKKNLLKDNL